MTHENSLAALAESFGKATPSESTRLPPEAPTNRDKIRVLHPRIEELLAAKYSYAGVLELLGEHGIVVAESTLKTYLREFRQEKKQVQTQPDETSNSSQPTAKTPKKSEGQATDEIKVDEVEYVDAIEDALKALKPTNEGSRERMEVPRPARNQWAAETIG